MRLYVKGREINFLKFFKLIKKSVAKKLNGRKMEEQEREQHEKNRTIEKAVRGENDTLKCD